LAQNISIIIICYDDFLVVIVFCVLLNIINIFGYFIVA